jgi:hypothetical protein
VVAPDLPTSWTMVTNDDTFTARMFDAINGMLLDMLAAVPAKTMTIAAGAKLSDRPRLWLRAAIRTEDAERNEGIARMLAAKQSWGTIQA